MSEIDKNAADDDDKPELDDDGNPIVAAPELWMKSEEDLEQERLDALDDDDPEKKKKVEPDDDDPAKNVPVGKFVALKKSLRSKIADRDEENEKLRRENEVLKANKGVEKKPEPITRPVKTDEMSDADYDVAMDEYYDKRAQDTFLRNKLQDEQKQGTSDAKKVVVEAVDAHYDRAAKLVESSGIKPEIYKQADLTVRQAVEASRPKWGDAIVDQVIHLLGEGSEKVMYFLGRNKPALAKFQNLLTIEPSGMQAAVYLGQEKQRLTKPQKARSNAPAPASHAKGDVNKGASGTTLKRAYSKAHKSNNTQAAYNAKKAARAAGVDVSNW